MNLSDLKRGIGQGLILVFTLFATQLVAALPVFWSDLGVTADGIKDNTKALNELPEDRDIIGDCPAGEFIRVNSVWLLKSNLHLKILGAAKSYLTLKVTEVTLFHNVI